MGLLTPSQTQSRLALFAPPYEDFLPIDLSWTPLTLPPRGLALVWWLTDAEEQEEEFQWLYDRPHGLPLFVILPPPHQIARAIPLLGFLTALEPKAILPAGRVAAPFRLRQLLAAPPRHLAKEVTDYLVGRHLLRRDDVRREVKRIFDLAPEVTSISKLARRLSTSRRTLGRHFEAAGLPVPSHWLQFARLMYIAVRLQNDPSAVFRIASHAGYPDGFTMSNQMKRLLDCRPTEIREALGWEWIVEAWIRQETLLGEIDHRRHHQAVHMYLPQPDAADPSERQPDDAIAPGPGRGDERPDSTSRGGGAAAC